MIDWSAFVVVALVALFSAAALVSLYSFGLRLLAVDDRARVRTIAGYACFVVCALGVLFGIYLIVPALHS
ncbi:MULTISPECIES: hypothetical protein [Frigoribacterium]|uniref:hypothetical protein n=1 Tax=Frigoribacterium TaxID=96492 RepID=UPI001786E903|nr:MULTISPECIES: hypothetical protein [Frigoribacterium]MBD8703263.1 hypothetical protein [Frigoribacterium sp. CFBP 13712]MCJ0701882.1 hypothetical protein [Frigoribacterium faeni]MDY0890700.1 hypothetical protein [Frigoribacterium sp. CFBP9030]